MSFLAPLLVLLIPALSGSLVMAWPLLSRRTALVRAWRAAHRLDTLPVHFAVVLAETDDPFFERILQVAYSKPDSDPGAITFRTLLCALLPLPGYEKF
jgi:hypothetical protein